MRRGGSRPRRFFRFRGRLLSVRQIVELTGMEYSTVVTRLYEDKPLEAPLGGPLAEYEWKGKRQTIHAWAREWDVSTDAARQRMDYYRKTGRAIRHHNGSQKSLAMARLYPQEA